jgi:hypothetical protein
VTEKQLREFIIEQIRDGYDRAPDDYKPGDTWDDGAGRIADAIITGPLADAFRTGAEAMREDIIWTIRNRSDRPHTANDIAAIPLPNLRQ